MTLKRRMDPTSMGSHDHSPPGRIKFLELTNLQIHLLSIGGYQKLPYNPLIPKSDDY